MYTLTTSLNFFLNHKKHFTKTYAPVKINAYTALINRIKTLHGKATYKYKGFQDKEHERCICFCTPLDTKRILYTKKNDVICKQQNVKTMIEFFGSALALSVG